MLVSVPLPLPRPAAPPPSPAPTRWAFLVGRRTRAQLQLLVVYSPATPLPPTPPTPTRGAA